MNTLQNVGGEMSEPEKRLPVLIDISEHFPARSTPVVLEWQSPSVQQVYRIAVNAEALLKRNVEWEDALAMDVATMAVCHLAPTPGGMTVGAFYESIANNRSELYFDLLTRLQIEFPHLKGTNKDTAVIMSLCVQYLMRHPEELAHLPSHILADLQKFADAKKAAGAI